MNLTEAVKAWLYMTILKKVNRSHFESMRREPMDKYGVDTTQNTKTANDKTKCPECGSALDPNSPTPKCPVHGTAPFEDMR